MPRFSDQWLIDKTLFDYVQGGSCACCAFNFLPGGTAGLIQSMSEFETDAANAEIGALEKLPWPPDMKDQVWMERVRLRQFCKGKMKEYRDFWREHGQSYAVWLNDVSVQKLRKLFQLPRSEIVERLKQQNYRFHSAFGTVLCAVTEQVAHFDVTGYPVDGRGEAEIGFEECLTFSRQGGFTLRNLDRKQTKAQWLKRHEALGGPKLLDRNTKRTLDDDNSDDGNNSVYENDTPKSVVSSTPSFRSDRRLVRLLIARAFADVLQRAYLKDNDTNRER